MYAYLMLVLALALASVTLLAFLPIAHGLSRSADFPRQQVLLVATGLLVAGLIWPTGIAWTPALLGIVCAVQAGWIARFTPLWPSQSSWRVDPDPDRSASLVVLNVQQSNRRHDDVLALFRRLQADLVALVEVDERWASALATLHGAYPYRTVVPADNGYGMALYSRFAMEAEVRDLLVDRIPSIHARVVLPNGTPFRLVVAHPEPPVPHHDTVGRDAEIGQIARLVAADPLPTIVVGDLNDVGWSRTTRRFQRVSGLRDPRVGRGFYNTFHARVPLARWPLDHLFHDGRFAMVTMERGPYVGSDHFPMLYRLVWTGRDTGRAPEAAREEDHERIEALVEREVERTREPIGEDWERD